MNLLAGTATPGLLGNVKRCAMWTACLALPIAVACYAASLLSPRGSAIFQEGEIVEDISVGVWAAGMLAGLWGSLRARNCAQRLVLAWLAGIALLAGLREIDLHTALNPDTLGEYGVRYKLSWWLSGATPLWLKAGWAGLFLAVAFGLAYPPLRARGTLLRLLREGDVRLLLLCMASVFLALGFAVDDLLRGSAAVKFETRQFLEETSELIGAVIYVLAVLELARRPLHPTATVEDEQPAGNEANPPASR